MQPDNNTEKEIDRYIVFLMEHNTRYEGSRRKIHVMDYKYGQTLCGLVGARHRTSGGTGQIVNDEWINQPDPDEVICKKCKKFFLNK